MKNIDFVKVTLEKHIDLVKELARIIWKDHYIPIIGEEQVDYMLAKFQSRQAIKEQIEKGYGYYIIYYEGNPAGYIGFISDMESKKLFLSKFYILDKLRGKGLGRAALSFIEDRGKETGMKKVWLTVNKHNSGSIAAYEKMGLAGTSEIVQDIGSGYVMDDFVMEKNI